MVSAPGAPSPKISIAVAPARQQRGTSWHPSTVASVKVVRAVDAILGAVLDTMRLAAYVHRSLVSLQRRRTPLAARIAMYR